MTTQLKPLLMGQLATTTEEVSPVLAEVIQRLILRSKEQDVLISELQGKLAAIAAVAKPTGGTPDVQGRTAIDAIIDGAA